MNLPWLNVGLDLFLVLIQDYIQAWFTGRFIRTRKMKLFCFVYVFLYTLGYAAFEYIFPGTNKGMKAVVMPLMAVVVTLLFRERGLVRSLLFPVLFQLLLLSVDMGNFVFLRIALPDYVEFMTSVSFTGDLPYGSLSFSLILFLRLIGIAEVFITGLVNYYVLRGKPGESSAEDKRLNRFVPIFIAEMLFIGFLMIFTALAIETEPRIVWLMFSSVFVLFVLDVLIWHILRTVENTAALKHELQELSLLSSAQSTAYDRIMEGHAKFRMLRHDMLNQLQSALLLLEHGETEAAVSQLKSYSEYIHTSGKSVTGNSIVDAVLSLKEQACAEKRLTLEAAGKLPEALPFDNTELCAVTGNILDNAIHAMEKRPAGSEARLSFFACLREDKLVISCKNPSPPLPAGPITAPAPENEHGWGLYILDKLAKKYGGSFTLSEKEGTATALFWIPLTDTVNSDNGKESGI